MPATGPAPMLLPSYDQCIPDGYDWSAGGGGEEPVMDENERIALQEAEDERLAREMLQKEDDEVGGEGEEGGREGQSGRKKGRIAIYIL